MLSCAVLFCRSVIIQNVNIKNIKSCFKESFSKFHWTYSFQWFFLLYCLWMLSSLFFFLTGERSEGSRDDLIKYLADKGYVHLDDFHQVNIIPFPLCLWNRYISDGLEPVLRNIDKSCIASFPKNIRIKISKLLPVLLARKIGPFGLTKLVLII